MPVGVGHAFVRTAEVMNILCFEGALTWGVCLPWLSDGRASVY